MPHFFAGLTYSVNRRVVTSSYNVDDSDMLIGCNHTSEITLTLPTTNSVLKGRIYYIKDESGNASTNNIIIDGNGSNTIDGQETLTINGDYDCITIYNGGDGKWYVF